MPGHGGAVPLRRARNHNPTEACTPRQWRAEAQAETQKATTMIDATNTTTADAPEGPGFTLDEPVMLGNTELLPAGTRISVRKPDSGSLRGLNLMGLSQMDVVQLEQLAPRITMPIIQKGARLGAADLMQFGGEVLDFLLPRAAKAAVSHN
ncbi:MULTISPECIES: phage tail assembly protein [unclassified Sphingomonas]|uniref:phage tail assembly protein n=1 Tax=unclassified Sphingomonas TaxID=196159 RepID=UPI00226A480D|nr:MULTISPECIES: phage tail assembly protein [unclassified Sphingomonas]